MTKLLDRHVEYRRCHMGGAVYLVVEAALWLLSAGSGAAGKIPAAMIILLFGGMFIHPIAVTVSKLLGLPVPADSNRLSVLNTWIALAIPLGIPLVFMATAGGRANLFYPAFAVLVGAHWLPFVYIYGTKSFAVLAGVLVLSGVLFGFVFVQSFAVCGFVVGGIHLVFGALNFLVVRREIERED